MFEFKKPVREDVLYVADNMRKADQEEVWASSQLRPRDALIESWEVSSHCTVATWDGVPVAVFGLATHSFKPGEGVPWLLATDKIDEVAVSFVKESRKVIDLMQEKCRYLSNYVHCKNRKSIRWLKAMGFTVSVNREKFGPVNEEFYYFYMRS